MRTDKIGPGTTVKFDPPCCLTSSMDSAQFADRYPRLFHMADKDSWPSMRRHGLLSTTAIVELFDPPSVTRDAILKHRRRTSVELRDDDLGSITIRDQLPLKFLNECVHDGVDPQKFLNALNGRVFFWLSEERLERLLNARANRDRRHLILHIDTAALLAVHGDEVELAPYNTGSAHVPTVPKRGPDVFTALAAYPFEEWRRKRGKRGEPVVELTVPGRVPDVDRYVLEVELRGGGQPTSRVDLDDQNQAR